MTRRTSPATTLPMLRLPAIPAPRSRTRQRDKISFYHPGYSSPNNVLFSLPRVDPSPSQPDRFGVHARTALVACQVIANNAFATGFLASDEKGTCRVDPGPQSVLTQSDYWFFVEGDDQYPVVPSFRDWEFPHGRLPSFWSSTEESLPTSNRCLVTNTSYALTEAHIIPREERDWFSLNAMHRYADGRRDIDGKGNIVTLRSDIHYCLDRRVFAFIPKPDEHHEEALVLHVLDSSYADFAELYHNRTLQLADLACAEYLFARFAWAVIHLVKEFIVEGFPRRIARFGRVSTETDHKPGDKGLAEAKVDWSNGESLKALYGGGGSRSASPRKRPAPSPKDDCDFDDDEDTAEDEVDDDWYAEHFNMAMKRENHREAEDEADGDWYAEHFEMAMERENPRGRKRARLSDHSFTTNMSTPPLSYSPATDGSTGGHDSPCHLDIPKSDVDHSKPNLDATTGNCKPLLEGNVTVTNARI